MRYAMILSISLVFVGATARAQNDRSAEIREKIEVVQTAAAKLAEAGHKEDAERMTDVTNYLKALGSRPFTIAPIKSRSESAIKKLTTQRDFVSAKITSLTRKLRKPADPALTPLVRELKELNSEILTLQNGNDREETREKIQHLRIAAEHLRQARMFDLTKQLLSTAGKMEMEIAEDEAKAAGLSQENPKPAEPPKNAEMDELKKEVAKLRAENEELRKQSKPN